MRSTQCLSHHDGANGFLPHYDDDNGYDHDRGHLSEYVYDLISKTAS